MKRSNSSLWNIRYKYVTLAAECSLQVDNCSEVYLVPAVGRSVLCSVQAAPFPTNFFFRLKAIHIAALLALFRRMVSAVLEIIFR